VTDETVQRPKAHILLVDDDEVVLRGLRDLLEASGYEVAATSSWLDGFHMARERRPDVLVTDLMFDGDPKGWQLVQAVILEQTTRHIPIIVVSMDSEALERGRERVGRLGIRVLPKPFDPRDLLSLVREALGR
jgi:CheY-like chemotaxis protein